MSKKYLTIKFEFDGFDEIVDNKDEKQDEIDVNDFLNRFYYKVPKNDALNFYLDLLTKLDKRIKKIADSDDRAKFQINLLFTDL